VPLAWKIDPADGLVVVVAKGDVTRVEVERYLDAIVEGLALGFRKIFDVHEGDTSMTADDVLPLATRMRGLHEFGEMGPLAVVLPPGRGKRLQRAFGMLAVAKRPMRLFDDPTRAYSWISKQDPVVTAIGAADPESDLESSASARTLAARIRELVAEVGAEAEEMRAELVGRGRLESEGGRSPT
jgi:hypothetical protein